MTAVIVALGAAMSVPHAVISMLGAAFLAMLVIVMVVKQMCNRVANSCDMHIFPDLGDSSPHHVPKYIKAL